MNKRDIVIGIVILAVLAGVIYFTQRPSQTLPETSPTPRSTEEIEGDIEGSFNINIPDDVEKTTLQSTIDQNSTAIATRDIQNNNSTITVLADLPDPDNSDFYQVWISNGEEERPIGQMRTAKGGYLLETDISEDLSDYSQIIVSRESQNDKTIENRVLEGNF